MWLWEFILFGVLSLKYRICSNNSRGRLFLFRIKRGWLLNGVDYFKYCLLEVMPWIFCFIIPLNKKLSHQIKLNMGILSVPNLVSWLIFGAWIVFDRFCWIRFHFNLTGRWWKRKWREGCKGGGGWLLEQSDYFKYFHQRGAFMGGGWLIETQLLFEEIQSINQSKLYFTVNFKKIASTNANISKGKAKTSRK